MTLDHANAMIAQLLQDAREPDYPHLVDMADLFSEPPTELQLLDALVEAFDVPAVEMVEILISADFMALREKVAA